MDDKLPVKTIEEVNNELPDIYAPEFIPFYVGIQNKYELSDLETKIYGFVRYYTTTCNKMFYFSNQQLKTIFCRDVGNISKAVSRLLELSLLEAEYEIKANGGTFRKMRVRLGENTMSDMAKTPSETWQKHQTNNNNIKDNNIKDIYTHFCFRFKRNESQYKLSDKRRQKIASRLAEFSFEDILKAIDHAADDDFYSGHNDRGWTADLDYITRSYEIMERLVNLCPRKGGQNGGFKHPNAPEKGKYDDIVER